MSAVGVLPTLKTGDFIVIKNEAGIVIHEGVMKAPQGHLYAVTDNGPDGFTYHFEDCPVAIPVSTCTIELPRMGKGFRVKPTSISW